MRTGIFGLAIAVLLGLSAVQPAKAEEWAAISSNSEAGYGPVVWRANREEAKAAAIAECKRVSRTCGSTAASAEVSGSSTVFLVMCCSRPRLGCAIGAEATRAAAEAQVSKVFSDAGFSACTIRNVLDAKTGRSVQ